MLVGIVLAILTPIVATLIQLVISRKREFLADASGASDQIPGRASFGFGKNFQSPRAVKKD